MSLNSFPILQLLLLSCLLFSPTISLPFLARNLEKFVSPERFLETPVAVSNCSSGCLKCDSASSPAKCLLCDIQTGNFFFLF